VELSRNHSVCVVVAVVVVVVVVSVDLNVTVNYIRILSVLNNAFIVNLSHWQQSKLHRVVFERNCIPTSLPSFTRYLQTLHKQTIIPSLDVQFGQTDQ